MFPPPITTATWTPALTTSPISEAMRVNVGGWMPYFPSPINASPDSLRRMRWNRRFEGAVTVERCFYPAGPTPATRGKRLPTRPRRTPGPAGALATHVADGLGHLGGQVFLFLLDALAQLEPGEAANADVLADLGDGLGHHLVDLLLVVLHEGLVHQADRLVVLLHLPAEDLVDHRLGLLLLPELGPLDLPLAVDHWGGDLLPADIGGVGGGNVEGQVAHQGLKVLVPGDEVGLAVHLDQGSDLPVVNVGTHQALGGDAPGLLRRPGDALLPEPLLGLGKVAL